jgi:hypothetical protein
LVIVRAEYNVKVVHTPSINGYVELVYFDLKVPYDPGVTRFACIYRSPTAPSKIVTEQAIAYHF